MIFFSVSSKEKIYVILFFQPNLNQISITMLNICGLCDTALCDKDYAGLYSDVRSASDKLVPKGGEFSPKMRRSENCAFQISSDLLSPVPNTWGLSV